MEANNEREDRLAVAKLRPVSERPLRERILESLERSYKPGDIVLINVSGWALNRCLATVEEVRPWGVLAYVQLPQSPEPIVGVAYMKEDMRAYVRLAWHQTITITAGSSIKNPLWDYEEPARD